MERKLKQGKDAFLSLGDALQRLSELLAYPNIEKNRVFIDAAIKRFEFCIELYWKALKKILLQEGVDTTTPKDVFAKSYQFHLIDDEKAWIDMIDDRNNTSHAYDQEIADEIFQDIKKYSLVMDATYKKLEERFYKKS